MSDLDRFVELFEQLGITLKVKSTSRLEVGGGEKKLKFLEIDPNTDSRIKGYSILEILFEEDGSFTGMEFWDV